MIFVSGIYCCAMQISRSDFLSELQLNLIFFIMFRNLKMRILIFLSELAIVAYAQNLLGGVEKVSNNDEAAGAIAYASKIINEGLHPASQFLRVVPKTIHKQVVAGMSYEMDVNIYETPCYIYQLNDDMPSEQECPKGKKVTDTTCRVFVWDQPWRGADRYKATKNDCITNYENAKPMLSDMQSEEAFEQFLKTYGKTYETEEERTSRFEIFKNNMEIAFKLQSLEKGTAVYGPSIYADITPDEFDVRRGLKLKQPIKDAPMTYFSSKIESEYLDGHGDESILPKSLPSSWDWRQHNAVTEVKNQGMCGSCWAFSTTGNIEGQWAIKKKSLISLSEQELLDCDKVDQACNGGLMLDAYKEIERIGGLESEKDYPYESRKEASCNLKKSDVKAKITGWTNISSNEIEMASWLQKNGPIAIGINANAMQFYMGGVSHPPSILCKPTGIDHGVLIVGYGKTWLLQRPYWIIKNSWGSGWGEKGYYRVYRGGGVCGLNQAASSAIV